MLSVETDGRVLLTVQLPGATSVEVVGAYDGCREVRWRMKHDRAGRWWIELPPAVRACREFLFKYLIDGAYCVLDSGVQGTRTTEDGQEMSRVFMPSG